MSKALGFAAAMSRRPVSRLRERKDGNNRSNDEVITRALICLVYGLHVL